MARIVEHTVYQFAELSDAAKERAREWWRQGIESDDYADSVIEDATECGRILGIEFDTRPVQLMSGKTRQEPCVWWSGVSSQGDGACFDGRFSYAKGAARKIREYAPQDAVLHGIADALQAVQRRHLYALEARTKQHGFYNHSGCMRVEVTDKRTGWGPGIAAEETVTKQLRAFADWIYRQLQAEYEYRTGDEQVDESIECNEYEFNEDGTRAA